MNLFRRSALAAALAVLAGQAVAGSFIEVDRPGPIAVRVEVDYGLLDSCGSRELPHLIEHVVLSETKFGETPADFIATLAAQGVRATAITRQDFTEFTFEGRPGTGDLIEEAILETLGRKTLPAASAAREVEAIRLELGAAKGFTSIPHPFESWSADHIAGTQVACGTETRPVADIGATEIQAAFDSFYGVENYTLSAIGPAGEIDGAALLNRISQSRPEVSPPERKLSAGVVPLEPEENGMQASGETGLFEVLIAIPGRMDLPAAKAREAAEMARLALQAELRKEPLAYSVKAVVHQSNRAGWVSLTSELPVTIQAKVSKNATSFAVQAFTDAVTKPIDTSFLSNREMAENAVHIASSAERNDSGMVGFQSRPAVSRGWSPYLVVVTYPKIVITMFGMLIALLAFGLLYRSHKPIRADG